VSNVGLVLGGGGITGAAFHFGALLALRAATGWDPDNAEVIVGTSSGAFAAAMVRGGRLDIETLVGDAHNRTDVAKRLSGYVYRRTTPKGLIRWVRRGLIPGIRHPDLELTLGSPALNTTKGIAEWVAETLGTLADMWPERATVIVGFDVELRERVPFGTEAAPPVPLKDAVAASAAVPFIFQPVEIQGRWYADGGIASGTSADLVLANPEPLDLLIVIAPLAAEDSRTGTRLDSMFDNAGRAALAAELAMVAHEWPQTDVIVLRPGPRVLAAARPNPLSVKAAVPSFLRTLMSMRDELARPETWDLLEKHLGVGVNP
jgi:NTE family protein